jgi:hypothetical protein
MERIPTGNPSSVRVARDPYPAPPKVKQASERAAKSAKKDALRIKKALR